MDLTIIFETQLCFLDDIWCNISVLYFVETRRVVLWVEKPDKADAVLSFSFILCITQKTENESVFSVSLFRNTHTYRKQQDAEI
jgi:hypothetical protein